MAMDYRASLVDQLDPMRKKAMPGDPIGVESMGQRSDNTGVAGGMPPPTSFVDSMPVTPPSPFVDSTPAMPATPIATASAPQPATPDYKTRGKYATFNAGADDKYNRPWDQLSERYKMQTVLSHFDPNQGITPEVIAALNAANINGAQFSGSKDKLDARNLSAWENYDGREGIGDIIEGFNDPNRAQKSWGAWGPEGPPAAAQGGTNMAGSLANPLLQGDSMGSINAALGKLAQPTDLIQRLIAQLQGGGNG